jgi:multiple sugar transport system substrate-binding protein
MRVGTGRFAVLLAVLALLFAACSQTTASPSPSGSAVASVEPSAGSSESASPPPPTPLPATESQAKPGDVVIRWYCCLGTGDAPEQVEVERKVAEDFNASHPGIHLQFEGFVYAAARDALSVQLGAGNGPDIVGPVGIGGAEAFHGQWLDLQPFIDKTSFDMSQFPESTVELYNAGGEGQVGIPYAIYPSVLFYKADMFKEAGLEEPPHEWNAQYKMPDGSMRPWDYDTIREIAKILTVDENGADATESGFDPDKIVQWGFEPQRDDLRQTGAYFGAGSFMASDGKTAQIPEPWKAAWKHF